MTVTVSSFVYATGGGSFLLLALLWLSGYRLSSARTYVLEFSGITVFVLVQIALTTSCGVIVARIASSYVSRRTIAQVQALESAKDESAKGNLERRGPNLTEDELGRLAG